MKLKKARPRLKNLTTGKATVFVPGGAKANTGNMGLPPPPLTYQPLGDSGQSEDPRFRKNYG